MVCKEYEVKRRTLAAGQEVILVYDASIGFIKQSAQFKEYHAIMLNGIKHHIPVFQRLRDEITGLECFWILPSDIDDDARIEQIQRELIDLQVIALEIGQMKKYNIPEKIQSREINNMTAQHAEYRTKLISQLGYDPLDYSWVERELAATPLERCWFKFQRENKGSFDDNWTATVERFKDSYQKDVSVEEAFDLTRKWKRYLMGAWNTIVARNPNIEDWKTAAKQFEEHHRASEQRMMDWSIKHQDERPQCKVVEPIQFQHGPYFNECVERVPHLFVDATCYQIVADVILEVTAYDPELKYIRLDFTKETRNLIKPGVLDNDPWRPLKADYIIYVLPEQVDTHLEFLSPLEEN